MFVEFFPTLWFLLHKLPKHLVGGYRENGASLLSVASSDRMSGNGLELDYNKFHLNLKKKTQNPTFFTVRVMKHWLRLPRKVVESPSLEILKTQQNTPLSHGLGEDNLQRYPLTSAVLWFCDLVGSGTNRVVITWQCPLSLPTQLLVLSNVFCTRAEAFLFVY